MTLSTPQLVLVFVGALLLGVVGATATTLYHRHSAQHWEAEKFILEQRQLNTELIRAVQALGAQRAQ